MQWYYAIGGERFGPVTHTELERLVQVRTVAADTLIWRQGMNEWQTLATVRTANPAWFDAPRLPTPPELDSSETAAAPLHTRVPTETTREQPVGLTYAGFWSRCGAHIVDFFLWWVLWRIFVGMVGTAYFPEAMSIAAHGPSYEPKAAELIVLVRFLGVACAIGLGLAIAYDAFFLLRFGATPGKLLFGLRVVKADGSPLGFVQIVARCLAKSLVGLTLGIGYLVMAVDEQKRGLHDYICNTRVVKKR